MAETGPVTEIGAHGARLTIDLGLRGRATTALDLSAGARYERETGTSGTAPALIIR